MTPLTLTDLLNLAIGHAEAGRYSAAEHIHREILKRLPDQVNALHLLGAVALSTGRIDLSLHLLERALVLAPGEPLVRGNAMVAHRVYARELQARGLEETARRHLRRADAIEASGDEVPGGGAGPAEAAAGLPPTPARAPVTILMCGQVRHEPYFRESLRVYLHLRDQGVFDRLVISTWAGEMDRFPGLKERLQGYGVEFVESPPLDGFATAGNYLHQTAQLYNGLLAVDSDAWVFKTRPDAVLSLNALDGLFQATMAAPPVTVEPRAFERRVWVPYFEATQPFFISDVVFFGRRDDLLKLCNFDMVYEVNRIFDLPDPLTLQEKVAAAETRKYLNLFALHFPILNEFKDTWQYAEYYRDTRNDVLDYNFRQKIYWEYMALYLHILHSHFLVGQPYYHGLVKLLREFEGFENRTVRGKSSEHFPNCVEPSWFFENLAFRRNRAGQVFCNDSTWLANLFEGRIQDPYLDFCLHDSLERALAYRSTPERRHAFALYKTGLRRVAGYGREAAARTPEPAQT